MYQSYNSAPYSPRLTVRFLAFHSFLSHQQNDLIGSTERRFAEIPAVRAHGLLFFFCLITKRFKRKSDEL